MVFLSLYILDEKRSSERKYNDSFIEIFPEVTLKNAEQFILEMEHQKSTFCQKSCVKSACFFSIEVSKNEIHQSSKVSTSEKLYK